MDPEQKAPRAPAQDTRPDRIGESFAQRRRGAENASEAVMPTIRLVVDYPMASSPLRVFAPLRETGLGNHLTVHPFTPGSISLLPVA